MVKKSYIRLIILCILGKSFLSFANTDSLKNRIQKAITDTEKLRLNMELVAFLKQEDLEEAKSYALSGVKLAESTSDYVVLREFLNELGEISSFLGDYDEGISYLLRAESIILDLKEDETIAKTYNVKGKIYYRKGDFDKALKSFQQGLEVMEESHNLEGQAFYLNNIGIIYDLQLIYDKALEYYQRSLDIKIKLGMVENYPASFTNLGVTYYNLGDVKKSLLYHEKALEGHKAAGNKRGIGRSLNNIGFAHLEMGDEVTALTYFTEAVKYRLESGDTRDIAQTYTNIAQANLELGNLDSCEFYLDKAYAIAFESGQNHNLKNVYRVKSDWHQKKGEFEQALEMEHLYGSYADSLRNEDAYQKIAEMEARYELSRRELEIEQKEFDLKSKDLELGKERANRNFYVTLAITSLIIVIFLFFRYAQKIRINRLIKNQLILIEQQKEQLSQEHEQLYQEFSDQKQVLDQLFSKSRQIDLPPELLSLSKREMEVLSFLALGWKDSDIASKMFISKATVKTHLRRIYSKLMVKGRAGAVAVAHKYKILGGEVKTDG